MCLDKGSLYTFSMTSAVPNIMTDKPTLFENEFLPHADALYNFAYHLTYHEEDANDLVQETFLKAYRYMGHYEPGTNAKAWLFKILKNGFINEYRKATKRPNSIDFQEVEDWHQSDDESTQGKLDMREEIFAGLMGDEVTKALNALPVDFKTVILLCDIEGFTYEEIAKIVDIPIGTVRSRLHRARQLLKEKLEAYAATLGYTQKQNP
jgi:RNA polymerase sigma factor (sigma-70 family)